MQSYMQHEVDFLLKDTDGNMKKLTDFKGKNIILYFYPKDFTKGCTKLACDFRDYFSELAGLNTIVIGISPDPASSHHDFLQTYKLPYILVDDEDLSLAKKFGAIVKVNNQQKIIRKTILINSDGELVKEWNYEDVEGHVAEIIQQLKSYK
jgi:thioredoxin-dependent peroxiredoxin